MQQPPLITYNLKERGRAYTGKERNFNIKAIYESVNSPRTQERVRTRGMVGYYGHGMRALAGLEPRENLLVAGKYNDIDPAIVTVHLKAYPDGTIEHQTEFLDTEPGRKCARLHAQKIGGFSSAIADKTNELFGFDYVLDPNYSTNRGFVLDSVSGLTLDSVLAEVIDEEEAGWLSIIGQRDALIQHLQTALDSATEENEQYASMLASGRYGPEATLDSATAGHLIVPVESVQQIQRDIHAFRTAAALPRFVEPQSKDPAFADEYERVLGVIGHV
jgi:hypothetical protein